MLVAFLASMIQPMHLGFVSWPSCGSKKKENLLLKNRILFPKDDNFIALIPNMADVPTINTLSQWE